ncbi:hypothetical protein F5879DRAFT_926033 [Lentinula edodes]|nr:hypothetical protein F5879DRAFT_926033 [Lentinula edodes]
MADTAKQEGGCAAAYKMSEINAGAVRRFSRALIISRKKGPLQARSIPKKSREDIIGNNARGVIIIIIGNEKTKGNRRYHRASYPSIPTVTVSSFVSLPSPPSPPSPFARTNTREVLSTKQRQSPESIVERISIDAVLYIVQPRGTLQNYWNALQILASLTSHFSLGVNLEIEPPLEMGEADRDRKTEDQFPRRTGPHPRSWDMGTADGDLPGPSGQEMFVMLTVVSQRIKTSDEENPPQLTSTDLETRSYPGWHKALNEGPEHIATSIRNTQLLAWEISSTFLSSWHRKVLKLALACTGPPGGVGGMVITMYNQSRWQT